MLYNVNGSNILKDLFNLVFFSGKGSEIYMQKEYTIEWEFVPADEYRDNFISVPKGFVAGKIIFPAQESQIRAAAGYDINDPNLPQNNYKIRLESLVIGVTDGGKFTFNNTNTNFKELFESPSFSNNGAKIRFKFNNSTTPQVFELPFLYNENTTEAESPLKRHIVQHNGSAYLFTFTYNELKISSSNNDKKYGYVTSGVIDTLSKQNYLITQLERNFKNVAFYYPFIKYVGDYYQEPVSTGFIAADTFLILAKDPDVYNTKDVFHRPHIGKYVANSLHESEFAPYIETSENIDIEDATEMTNYTKSAQDDVSIYAPFQLVFQPANNSEIFIIDHDVNYNLLWDSPKSKEYAVDLYGIEAQYYNNPITFAVGFKSMTEGCYQNFLGIYLRHKDIDYPFFMGVLNIKTTVEGEDERFRTLLTNFGIPDPVKYSNIFKEVDYEEDGYDYRIINKKSKELFLTYDKIFSYVGTYKALLNAVKFLGYSDIVFKEWYKFKDIDNKIHNLAVRRIDLTSENYVKFHDEYGIDFEKYINYTKLNKLTMIYHLNELAEDPLYIKYKQHFIVNGEDTYQTQYMYDMLDNVVPVYELRNDEILAKLFGVKEWLEAHIIGVGAYISDISGEGLYVGGIKTQTYSTMHHLADYHEEEYVTPVITNISEFKVFEDEEHSQVLDDLNYGSTVECTLTEYTGLTFEDYQNVTFESFERVTIPVQIKNELEPLQLKIGNPIETPVLFDEIEYSIDVSDGSGTVTEFKSNDDKTELYVNEGEITLLSNDFKTSFDKLPDFTAKNTNEFIFNAPTIFIETGTIRDPKKTSWIDNVIYSINEELSESGEVYNVKNIVTGETVGISPKTIILKPRISVVSNKKLNAPSQRTIITYSEFKYSMNNNFNVPVIMVTNYDIIVNDTIINEDKNNTYIIDIITGRIEFYKQKDRNDYKLKTEIFFSDDNRYDDNDQLKFIENPREQVVKIKYEFTKDRQPLIKYNKILSNVVSAGQNPDDIAFNGMFDSFNDILRTLEDITEINAKIVNMQINRTGNYTVKAKTYNKFNNIFTSKNDKEELVETQPINIDVYIQNQNFSNNDKSIYPKNINGIKAEIIKNEIEEEDPEIPKRDINVEEENNNEPETTETEQTQINEYNIDNNSFNEESIKTNYHYHSENIEYDYTNPNEFTYLNITYALDTPKNNEHVLLYPTKLSTEYKENEIIESTDIESDNNDVPYYWYDNYKIYNLIPLDMLEEHNGIRHYNVYINHEFFNTNYKLTYNSSYNNDENETKCTILYISKFDDNFPIPENEFITNVLKIGDVIKIKYEVTYKQVISKTLIKNHEETNEEINESPNNNINDNVIIFTDENNNEYRLTFNTIKTFTNSICYRIINIEDNKITINGWLDDYIISLRNEFTKDSNVNDIGVYINTYLSYPHEETAYYDVEITEDADEYKTYINDIPYLKTKVKYNDQRLFINDYLDNNYRLYLYDFDYNNFENIWWKHVAGEMYINPLATYYKYVNFPVTYERNKQVLAKSTDNYFIYDVPYHEWIWQTYHVQSSDNFDNLKTEKTLNVLFKSTNNTLNVYPDMQGRQDIILKSIDKYGNIFKNQGEGLLFLK